MLEKLKVTQYSLRKMILSVDYAIESLIKYYEKQVDDLEKTVNNKNNHAINRKDARNIVIVNGFGKTVNTKERIKIGEKTVLAYKKGDYKGKIGIVQSLEYKYPYNENKLEDIIAANPDVIFVVYMPYAGDDPETVKNDQLAVIQDDEALQSLDAVKNGRVYPIMLSEMYASATRTQDGIETFAKGLYPDVNLD